MAEKLTDRKIFLVWIYGIRVFINIFSHFSYHKFGLPLTWHLLRGWMYSNEFKFFGIELSEDIVSIPVLTLARIVYDYWL